MKYSFFIILALACFIAEAQPTHLVISQVYGGGGNSGAPWSHDFIELFNPTANDIDLSGHSLQYTSASGTSWTNVLALQGNIEAGKYFLVKLAGGTNGQPLPTADQTGTINLSAISGKIILALQITAFPGSCPAITTIIDKLGYGTADCFETAAAPNGSNSLALVRRSGGCTDNNDNSQDFITGSPQPRNSAHMGNDCAGTGIPLPVRFSGLKASSSGGKLKISWVNLTESEIEAYNVEMSYNGSDFFKAGEQKPALNQGSAAGYSMELPLPQRKCFARIKAIEIDGKKVYSQTLLLDMAGRSNGLNIYPHPVKDGNFNLLVTDISGGEYEVLIVDVSGREVFKTRIRSEGGILSQRIVTGKNVKGLHFLMIKGRNEVSRQVIFQ
jgi:hypothetical protein